ncbi:hypothetical protein Palpr_1571 [Paludibacter propionicigenes WB4]|uniref:Lipoprotein n=1 Tax=Paludibacter propionicigenes (strain DSM 17365 / JCM 13257 / WB4) TaxID=694427 RepID=E4T4S2_PALPW|nr:TolB-like 6-bladed beta-propeller domain-containing protein [Paludibacter propionicigenes]ADQ79716.1 hypothetical protein Palpr_1571 [Paludibacter propionicigenes WB4]
MNYNKLLQVFVLVLLLQSCVDTNKKLADFGAVSKKISGKVLSSGSVYMRYPFRVKQTDSTLVIMDLHGSDFYYHEFSYPQLKFKQSFAKPGIGPNEFLDAENIRFDKQGKFYCLDANKSLITIFDSDKNDTTARIKLSDKLIRTLDFDIVNDSTFVVPDYTGKHRFNLINRKGQITKSCFTIPSKRNKLSNVVLAQAWRSFIDYNPSNGVLAMVTQLGQVLEIYDLKKDSIINIVYGKADEPEFINKGGYASPCGIMGYSDVYVGKDKIYAIFWGKSFKDIENDPNSKDGGNLLQVFDLTGKPLRQYVLDKYITGFTVDEKHNKIIALDINGNYPLVEYQL